MVGSGLALLVTGETEEVERLLLESSGPSRQSEGALGVDGGHQGVSGQRGKIGQQRAKAVNRQPVLGLPGGLLVMLQESGRPWQRRWRAVLRRHPYRCRRRA